MPKQNITFALFDVRPLDPATNRVNFEFINNLKLVIDLAPEKKKIINPNEFSEFNILPINPARSREGSQRASASNGTKAISSLKDNKGKVLQELEITLSENFDFNKELNSLGGTLVSSPPRSNLSSGGSSVNLRPKYSSEGGNLDKFREEFSKMFSSFPSQSSTKVGDESPYSNLSSGGELKKSKLLSPPPYLPWAPETEKKAVKKANNLSKEKNSKSIIYFSLAIAFVFGLTFFSVESINLKNNLLNRSNLAYINLNSAQENISQFNFFQAASAFSLAARNFELINQDLNKVSSIFKVLDKITLGSTEDVSELVKAGGLISQAALDLNQALSQISSANFISLIQEKEESNILEILSGFRLSLVQASRNLNEAQSLILSSDSSLIPESERDKFDELKQRLPDFNSFIEKAVDYSGALMAILGQSSPQKYLILFQNSSEIRPTGGFPGSYALVEFDKGVMKEFFVDDIYNPDGQMKEKIIPPKPLQKITPNWGMRDANWFVDFPASAKKVAEFYYKDTRILVDGVFAVNVSLVPEILKITGPIAMPDFNLTLDSENFISEIQKEVEYERTKGEGQPKQVLVDFAPKFLERLSALDQESWLKVFMILVSGIEQKDILAYFADSRLQNFALANNLAGEIKDFPSAVNFDYLMVVHSNIMGSKTDAVIENSASLEIKDSIHTLEIKRYHQGGDFGFYNKKNNDYVRVLLPEDAEFIEINGNDSFETNPLLDYGQNGFETDPDLERYESKIKRNGNVEIFEEEGKKVLAFWMVIEPGQSKTVRLKYKTRDSKNIYLQKQPGLETDFKLILNGRILFDEKLSSDKNITLE